MLDLDDIRRRWFPYGGSMTDAGWTPRADIGPLLAEVERLRAALERTATSSQWTAARLRLAAREALEGGE